MPETSVSFTSITMASPGVMSNGVVATRGVGLILVLLVGCPGGAASPLSSQFKVYGLDTVRAGQATFLNCHLEGSDTGAVTRPPSYVWVKDGKVIPGQTDMFLRFKGVTREDAGLYQCGAPGSDVGGEGRHLHVVVPGDILPRPRIEYTDRPVCGRPYSLHCIFLERYIPSNDTVYTWYKDHIEVKGQSGQTLSFPNVTETDRGEYVCTGREGGVETTSPPSEEHPMEPLVIPQVTMETPSTDSVAKGILGQNLTLTARVIRALPQVPHDGYSWSFFPFPEGQQRHLVEKSNTLTLGPLTREDRGQYLCQARNDQGNRDLRLIGQASITVDVVYLKDMTLTPDLEVKESDPVTLACGVHSHPIARLAWTVNGREVRHVTYNVDHYVILSAACSDSNNYTCGASNPDLPGLEIHATVQLTVLCRQAATETHTTLPPSTTTDFTPELADSNSDKVPWTIIGMVLTAVLGVIMVVVVGFILYSLAVSSTQTEKLHPLPLLTVVLQEAETQQAMQDHTVVDMDSVSRQESTVSDERSCLLEHNSARVKISTSPEETGVRRRQVRRRQSADSDGLESREPVTLVTRRKKSTSESRIVPPIQGQRVSFDEVYQNGKVYVLPLLQDKDSKGIVIKRLYQVLSTTVLHGDPPVFLCTESLPCHMHAIVYYKKYGVIVIKVSTLVSLDDVTPSQLKHAAKELLKVGQRLKNELQDLLHPNGVTLLLVLPELKHKGDIDGNDMAWLQEKKIHVLVGKTKADYLAWLQTLPTTDQEELWGLGGDSAEAFRTAVSSFLSMKSYGDDSDPSTWLLTQEQASVLQRTDKLLHVGGPPGSGKTLLLMDRVRRWLSRGKIVVLAVCCPSYELLLHRLAEKSLEGLPNDTASHLHLCKTAKELKKAMALLGESSKPSEICVAIDAIKNDFLATLLDVYNSSIVESAWTTSRADFPKSEEFQKLGGRSACLSQCLRSPAALQHLARKVMPPGAVTAPWTDPPHPDTSASLYPPLVTVELHPLHPGNQAGAFPNFDCGKCDVWLRKSLPLHLLDRKQWKHWVVLLTGDWGSDSQLTEKLVSWLTRQGVPAVHEWRLHDRVSTTSTSTLASSDEMPQDTEDRAELRARVVSSVDKEGRPAVHVMRSSLFRGLEKPCVLVVHYDWRDDHPDEKSKRKQNSREAQHRYQLFRATIRCQAVLAVLLLSPSPAASLLPLNK